MPYPPFRGFLDAEPTPTGAASRSFWLHGLARQFPDFENADTLVDRLVREGVLARDPLSVPPRTVVH